MSEAQGTLGVLSLANAAIHREQEEGLLEVIEALTRLEVDEAESAFEKLNRALCEHLEIEDATTHAAYGDLGDAPRGAGPELFSADHVSIAKVTKTCVEAFDGLGRPGADQRRRVVLVLPLFFRLRSVLEHHTAREERFLYPRLDEALEPAKAQELALLLQEPAQLEGSPR